MYGVRGCLRVVCGHKSGHLLFFPCLVFGGFGAADTFGVGLMSLDAVAL